MNSYVSQSLNNSQNFKQVLTRGNTMAIIENSQNDADLQYKNPRLNQVLSASFLDSEYDNKINKFNSNLLMTPDDQQRHRDQTQSAEDEDFVVTSDM